MPAEYAQDAPLIYGGWEREGGWLVEPVEGIYRSVTEQVRERSEKLTD